MKKIYTALVLTLLSTQIWAQENNLPFQKAFEPLLKLSRHTSVSPYSSATKKTRSGSRLLYTIAKSSSSPGQDSTVYFYNGNWGYDPTSDFLRSNTIGSYAGFLSAEMELANVISNNHYTQYYDSSVIFTNPNIPFHQNFYVGCQFNSLHQLVQTETHSDSNQYHLVKYNISPLGVQISLLDSINNFNNPTSAQLNYSYDTSGLLLKIEHWDLQPGLPNYTLVGFDSLSYNTNGQIDSVFTMTKYSSGYSLLTQIQTIQYTSTGDIAQITRMENIGPTTPILMNNISLSLEYDAFNRIQSLTNYSYDTTNSVWTKTSKYQHHYPNTLANNPDSMFIYYGDSAVYTNYEIRNYKYNSADQITEYLNFYHTSGTNYYSSEQQFYYSSYTPNGTEELEESSPSIMVYPNPATNQLNVRCNNSKAETGTIDIINLQGAQLSSEKIPLRANAAFTLDISSLSVGIYLLHVTTADYSSTLKFEKK